MNATATYAAPLSRPQDERAAVALAAAPAPSPEGLDLLDAPGTAPDPRGGRRVYHPIVNRAGWLLCNWTHLATRYGQEGGRL